MGVKACDCNGCEAVMCDRYSSRWGYICTSDFHRLVARGAGQNISSYMEEEVDWEEWEARNKYWQVLFKEGSTGACPCGGYAQYGRGDIHICPQCMEALKTMPVDSSISSFMEGREGYDREASWAYFNALFRDGE